MQQSSVHFLLQVGERGKMFQMCRLLFPFLPQVLNRSEVRRVGWQLFDGQAIGMYREKRSHGLAGMIPRPILYHHYMLGGLRQDIEQKRGITLGVEAPSMGLVEEPPG